MNPEEDPWLSQAHKNAEQLEGKIRQLSRLTCPITSDLPIITKYQDFWNRAKQISALFKELKPLAREDRDLLWKEFNQLCGGVKKKQRAEYGPLEDLSKGHFDEIMRFSEKAVLSCHDGHPEPRISPECVQALKTAGDLLGKYKHEMLAKHKKACFDRIVEIRKTHDVAWETGSSEKEVLPVGSEVRIRANLTVNYERYRKAVGALENFQIGAANLRSYIDSSSDPDKTARAAAQLTETQARIKDIAEGMRKLEKWIEEDERKLG